LDAEGVSQLRATLHAETAKVAWHELERFFAGGSAIYVSRELDLVAVGMCLSKDQSKVLSDWMEQGKVVAVTDEQALAWHESDALVWALVIKPFVLVQPQA